MGDLARPRVPPLLRQLIDERVARLGDTARDRLAVAAVIGQTVPFDLWAAVADTADDELLALIERAVEAHLLTLDDGTAVRFAHALVRTALYQGVLPPRRRIWHRHAADALAATSRVDPDAVAYHLQQAEDPRAPDWLIRAGERAQRAYAWLTARDRYAAALALLDEDATRARERARLLYRSGRMLRFADPIQAIPLLGGGGPRRRCRRGPRPRGLRPRRRRDAALLRRPIQTRPCRARRRHRRARRPPPDHLADDPAIGAWVADAAPDVTPGAPPALPAGVNPRRGALVVWLAHAGRSAEARAMGEDHLARLAAAPKPDATLLGAAGDTYQGVAHAYAALGLPDEA